MSAEGGITKQIIMKTLVILSVVTILEIGVALIIGAYFPTFPKWLLNLFFVVLSLLKAFYITAEFMHMKYETKGFVFWTLIGLVLLVWFIIAMLYEGNSWLVNNSTWG